MSSKTRRPSWASSLAARFRIKRARLPTDEGGFTIVEVLVAAAVLASGLLGVVTMIDAANATDTTTKAREQGVSLARELAEAGRSIPYAQLIPASIVSKVQAKPGLGNANAGPGWTINSRGVTYGVSIGVCSVDDPVDGYGTEDANFACANNTGAASTPCSQLMGTSGSVAGDPAVVTQNSGTLSGQRSIGACGLDVNLDGRVDDLTQADASACSGGVCQNTPIGSDSSPDDYKRLVVLVAWHSGRGGYVLLTTLIANPGLGAGPTISAFGLQGGGSSTIASPTTTSLTFSATADSSTVSMQWSLNGAPQGNATNSGGNWTFPWTIGSASPGNGSETLDGNYTIGVTPFDSNGNAGPARSMTITLARRQPYAPVNFVGGHNGSIIDFQWSPNKEGDITGYQVYRIVGSGQPDAAVCSTSNARSVTCQDTNPPNSSSIQYYVRALDGDNSSTPPDPSATLTVTTSNAAPKVPAGLQASTSNGNTVLLWTAATPLDSETPTSDSISFYRIYRDGQAVANRYDTAPGTTTAGSSASYTDTATGGVSHTYWVTAVDPQLAESPAVGPVTR